MSSTVPPSTDYVTQEEFDFYEIGFLVACVVFGGVSLMLITAIIGIFIKVQNLQKKIHLILSPSKSLRPNEDLSKRYAMMSDKNPKSNNSGPNLRYESDPETSGYQRRDLNEKGIPSAMRHSNKMNDLYY
ncbi:hypothetical protein RN001_006848 [Aquatica leii]|uniref:Uncharacterized protein n=1 Tax=Aquatica leii TaxID=1421715 RepID=A0AAN7SK35_9COLE|nr:hypothetical protein RN001_006848 [Aquatica leii]